MGVCNCSMFCCALLYVHSSFVIIMGKRELVALLSLSSWCLVIVVWLFLAVPSVVATIRKRYQFPKGKQSAGFEKRYSLNRFGQLHILATSWTMKVIRQYVILQKRR